MQTDKKKYADRQKKSKKIDKNTKILHKLCNIIKFSVSGKIFIKKSLNEKTTFNVKI